MWHLSNEKTEIYLCGIVGENALDAFNQVVDRYFIVEEVKSDEEHEQLGRRACENDHRKRLRALLRLRRINVIMGSVDSGICDDKTSEMNNTNAIGRGPKTDGILFGPRLVRGEIEVHICRCSRLLYREVCHVFPNLSTPVESLLVIPTNQHAVMELVKVGEDVEEEKDRCLVAFMDFGKKVCEALRSKGFWADYIDPCSGLPMMTPDTTKVYSEVDGMQILLHYKTMDAGMCKVLLHPRWGSAVYPASAFTNAPFEEVQEAVSPFFA
jgi:hypothetical protein